MKKEEILLVNSAITLGLVESGCQVVTSYPGKPSSEILPEVIKKIKSENLNTYVECSTNEKVAPDNAFTAAITEKRSACYIKQVGLNVAADSLMSVAYLGTVGGMVIISADDPFPHSSQTEQDTLFMARLAKVPVLDPSDPQEARKMIKLGMEISEEFSIPVILRPAIRRVCHARQNIEISPIQESKKEASFEKNPMRWADTPKFRYLLYIELNKKLKQISRKFSTSSKINFHNLKKKHTYKLGIIAGAVSYAVIRDILDENNREAISVLKIGTPYPYPDDLSDEFTNRCDRILVLEETDTLIEYLLRDKQKILGRLSGHVPEQGELIPQVIYHLVNQILKELGYGPP